MSIKTQVATAYGLHIAAWLAMWLVFAGLLFFAAGVYLAIAAPLGPMPAAFITGGALIGVVIVLGLIAIVVQSASKRRKSKDTQRAPDNLLEQNIRPMIGDKATNWAKANTGLAVVGALSAGVLIAGSPRLRALLVRAAGPVLTRKTIQTIQQFSDSG